MKTITVDSSVLVAILGGEPGWRRLEQVLSDSAPIVSSVSVLETYLVTRKSLGEFTSIALNKVLIEYAFTVSEFGLSHLSYAQIAFEKYGKGRHPARLNFGDCIVYATAKLSDTPLLFVGDDFAKTDLEVVRIPEA
ncbi:MAG: type II toxin-antitoxin system VapC family toxin [Armatimonadetes bacterium]|nr:type II toxin-antitoxin system VapC family toxin [Armatimonadota bacterium]